MFRLFRQRLGFKLFASYLVVILVGTIVLAITTELIVPTAFDRHLSQMGHMMSGMMGGSTDNIEATLFANFRAGVTYALSLAALSAFLTALLVSGFVARQVIYPIQELVSASERIADGDYGSRVRIPGGNDPKSMDELAQLAVRFNQMANRLDQVETMRRQLIGDVAHELRTPLATIKGSMEGLIDGVLPADEETYMRVHQEADRLQRLVTDLQELSRAEAGANELYLQPLQITNLIQSTIHRLERQFEEKSVAIHYVPAMDTPLVNADPDRIQQVLTNLIGNALQYTPEGGQVTIFTRQIDSQVEIAIKDSGVGISTEQLPHIFTRFYRADKSRSRAGGGSGIGLTIAKHMVEAHGGRIWAESNGLDQGSTFYFTLPVASLPNL